MTKVYLVYMKGVTKSNEFSRIVWAVFTNKRKAQIYCRYRKEITDGNWLDHYQLISADWEVNEERIWTEDYTLELNQIQTEKLPY